jgi:uncharacterized coiled-coil protein SlyX
MLFNQFLKEHRTVQELKSTVAKQETSVKALVANLQQQASQIQKVSAQLAAYNSKPFALKDPASQSLIINESNNRTRP